MFNNIEWEQPCYDKDMRRNEKIISVISIISIFVSIIVAVREIVLLMARIFNVEVILFVFAVISILILPYIGVKIDLYRGYE